MVDSKPAFEVVLISSTPLYVSPAKHCCDSWVLAAIYRISIFPHRDSWHKSKQHCTYRIQNTTRGCIHMVACRKTHLAAKFAGWMAKPVKFVPPRMMNWSIWSQTLEWHALSRIVATPWDLQGVGLEATPLGPRRGSIVQLRLKGSGMLAGSIRHKGSEEHSRDTPGFF